MLMQANRRKENHMEKYLTPSIELVEAIEEDIITTSISIELPWLPLTDESEI